MNVYGKKMLPQCLCSFESPSILKVWKLLMMLMGDGALAVPEGGEGTRSAADFLQQYLQGPPAGQREYR